MSRSDAEIARWRGLVESAKKKNKMPEMQQRINKYKGSIILGRDFQESTEEYLKRKDLKKFWEWIP